MKVCAVTAALACAGGAAFAGHGGPSGSAPPTGATTTLDHFLCAGDPGAFCAPAKTTLPDGTTFDVANPQDRLVCTASSGWWHRRGRTIVAPTTVTVGNELGSAALVTGTHQWNCSIVASDRGSGHFSRARARSNDATVATFSCTSVHYPNNPASTFSTPDPLKVGDRSWVRVLDPSQLCTPADPAPAGVSAAAVTASADSLLCFRARVAQNRNHFFAPVLSLCVPSTVGGDTPAPGSTTTTVGATTTTAAATTTTTRPAVTTTTAAPTTTTVAPTTTTVAPTTTTTIAPTTSTTVHAQPCPGILVNGVCIITV